MCHTAYDSLYVGLSLTLLIKRYSYNEEHFILILMSNVTMLKCYNKVSAILIHKNTIQYKLALW
jgi:hypothetical protein